MALGSDSLNHKPCELYMAHMHILARRHHEPHTACNRIFFILECVVTASQLAARILAFQKFHAESSDDMINPAAYIRVKQ